jgi:hypothetical protein
MPLDAPFRLGQFIVDAKGRLQPDDPDATPTVYMSWRGLTVRVLVQRASDNGNSGGSLAISAVIGRVPSTASDPSGGAGRRTQALEMLQELAEVVDEGWQLRLLADHRASIELTRNIALPATAGRLLTEVTCFLLALAPYLDLLGEPDMAFETTGTAAALSGSGMANTWPG